jgi:hypothetical protein
MERREDEEGKTRRKLRQKNCIKGKSTNKEKGGGSVREEENWE